MPKIVIGNNSFLVDESFNALPDELKEETINEMAASVQSSQSLNGSETPAQKQDRINQEVLQYGRMMERQDLDQAVSGMNPLHKFVASAGVQVNKVGSGIADLMGMGSGEEGARRLEQTNDALAADSPALNMTGRMAGGVLMAAPLALGAEAAIPAGLGMMGRGALATGLGAIEGGVEKPFSDETRVSNTLIGAAAGMASEPLSMALQAGLKRIPFGALADFAIGKSNSVKESIEKSMRDAGMDYSALKPETKKILESINRADDVDVAIKEAMETEYGFKLTAGEQSGDFTQLSAESSAARQSQAAGDLMRDFKIEQNQAITEAGDRMALEAGGEIQGNEQVGTVLKEALISAKGADKKNYQALYTAAVIADAFYNVARESVSTHEGLLKDIGRELARLDILDPEEFARDIPFSIPDLDTKALGVDNAEDFMKFLNSKYSASDPAGNRILAMIKDAVESNADDVIARSLDTVDGVAAREFLDVAKAARAANRSYRGLWENKDVLQSLTGLKNQSTEPLKTASDVVKVIMQKPENARKVIAELQSRGSEQAVADLRTYVLKDIMEGSINPNVPVGDLGFFSGAKLTNGIKKNKASLEAILTPEQMSQLKGFEVGVGKATNKPAGAVNHSNTASKIADMIWNGVSRIPVAAPLAGIREIGANRTIKQALKSGREPVDHILKLDGNHVKLNALLRQVISQDKFTSESALAESE
jgi:hypothetical protein